MGPNPENKAHLSRKSLYFQMSLYFLGGNIFQNPWALWGLTCALDLCSIRLFLAGPGLGPGPGWGPYGPLWAHIWAHMGPHGPLGAHMGLPGQVLEVLEDSVYFP